MEIIKSEKFKGWYVGKFEPNLIKSDNYEFGFKHIFKGTKPDYHYHKVKTEYTILIEGKILLEKSGQIILPITTVKLEPFEKNDQYFLEDSIILIINTPSIKNDKYLN